jgi:hypothetical protein
MLLRAGDGTAGVPPPRDHISFPASAYVDQVAGDWLFVANSNSDLRYNNGTLVAVDLKAAKVDRDDPGQFGLCPYADYIRPDDQPARFCCVDFLDHSILNCDERGYVAPDSTIEIGSFGSGMVFQPFDEPKDSAHCGNPKYGTKMGMALELAQSRHECGADCAADEHGSGRLYIGVRGNSSLTWVDLNYADDGAGGRVPGFSCDQPPGAGQACTILETQGTAALEPVPVPDEPYALALDRDQDLLYIGHLKGDVAHANTGGVSLFDVHAAKGVLGTRGVAPTFIGPSQAFFPPDINGLFGVTSLTPRNGQIYATSRYGSTATSLVTTLPPVDCSATATPDTSLMVVPGGDTYATPLLGVEIRGIQFPPDMNRAFMLQRVPPALIGFDIANGAGGLFGNVPSDVLEMCQAPTFLQQYPSTGLDSRLYITCFESGQVYVVDPFVPRLTNVIEVGRGPAGLAFAPEAPDGERLAYVVGFSANNISVVDLTPGHSTQYHVIQRIGFPSAVPR